MASENYPFLEKAPGENEYKPGEFSTLHNLENNQNFIIKELGEASRRVEAVIKSDSIQLTFGIYFLYEQ